MKRHVPRIGALCAVLTVSALVSGSGPALASQVSCGATITRDMKLTSDLANCPNTGIVIGADNITLDLNGHTVGGDGSPVTSCPEVGSCDLGIDNAAGHARVTIRGGSIGGFEVGVYVGGASDNRIHRLSSADNSSLGILVVDSPGVRVDHNTSVRDGFGGVYFVGSRDGRIQHNSVTAADGRGIWVIESSGIRVDANRLDRNRHGIVLENSPDGVLKGNRISHSGGASIEVGGTNGHDDRIQENTLTDNGDGIVGAGMRNVFVDNLVTGSGFFGSPDTGGFGLILDGGEHNVVKGNVVTGGRGPAILLTHLESPDAPDHYVVSGNVANSKLDDGIRVDAGATATLLRRNTANDNGEDGIEVDAVGTTVTRNRANDNHDLGIEAVPGVVDGGRNRASGNGNALECTNLACF